MAIEVIAKIKQKNNGTFKLMDAVDVEMSNGQDLQTYLDNLKVGGENDVVYVGKSPPTEEDIDKLAIYKLRTEILKISILLTNYLIIKSFSLQSIITFCFGNIVCLIISFAISVSTFFCTKRFNGLAP